MSHPWFLKSVLQRRITMGEKVCSLVLLLESTFLRWSIPPPPPRCFPKRAKAIFLCKSLHFQTRSGFVSGSVNYLVSTLSTEQQGYFYAKSGDCVNKTSMYLVCLVTWNIFICLCGILHYAPVCSVPVGEEIRFTASWSVRKTLHFSEQTPSGTRKKAILWFINKTWLWGGLFHTLRLTDG